MKYLLTQDEVTNEFIAQQVLPHMPADARGEAPKMFAGSWDNIALQLGPYIVRMPQDEGSVSSLQTEARVKAVIHNPYVATPDFIFVDAEYPFSYHHMIPGNVLLSEQYEVLPDKQKYELALAVAQFFAHMHAVPLDAALQLGVTDLSGEVKSISAIEKWYDRLGGNVDRSQFDRFLDLYEKLIAGHDTPVFGHFDTHGWNMAFDHKAGKLNGIFDFGDVRIEKRHEDFSAPSTLSGDFAARLTQQYFALTGVPIDLTVVSTYTLLNQYSDLLEIYEDTRVCDPKVSALIQKSWDTLQFA